MTRHGGLNDSPPLACATVQDYAGQIFLHSVYLHAVF